MGRRQRQRTAVFWWSYLVEIISDSWRLPWMQSVFDIWILATKTSILWDFEAHSQTICNLYYHVKCYRRSPPLTGYPITQVLLPQFFAVLCVTGEIHCGWVDYYSPTYTNFVYRSFVVSPKIHLMLGFSFGCPRLNLHNPHYSIMCTHCALN